MEFTLLGNALVAALAAWGTIRVLRDDPAFVATKAWDSVIGSAMIGLLVGRLWAMLETGTNPLLNLFDVLLIRGGVSTVGASIGFLAALAWMHRATLWTSVDALAIPIVFGLAGWHGGCVVRGSCGGTATDLPWAVMGTSNVGRHPVEVYAGVLLAVLGWLLLRRWRNRSGSGVVFALGITGVALVRLATEPLRLHLGAGLGWFYGLGLVIGLGMLAWRLRVDGAGVEEPPQDA